MSIFASQKYGVLPDDVLLAQSLADAVGLIPIAEGVRLQTFNIFDYALWARKPTTFDGSVISSIVEKMPNIMTLDLTYLGNNGKGSALMDADFAGLETLASLRELMLRNHPYITDDLCRRLTSLEKLYTSNNGMLKFSFISDLNELTHLQDGGCGWSASFDITGFKVRYPQVDFSLMC